MVNWRELSIGDKLKLVITDDNATIIEYGTLIEICSDHGIVEINNTRVWINDSFSSMFTKV